MMLGLILKVNAKGLKICIYLEKSKCDKNQFILLSIE